MTQALNSKQIEDFKHQGFLANLQIFSPTEMDQLNRELPNILGLLKPGESTKEIREWHEASRFLFDICMDKRILDYVESLLGAGFYMWASNFFIKEPHSMEIVGWHQDAYYWPLFPIESLTVWVAFDDVGEQNGAMQVIPASHRQGMVEHLRQEGDDSVLSLQADVSAFDPDAAVSVPLKRGSISMHDDKLLHASPGNPSSRRRAGFTIRYSPNRVKCNLKINPHFRIFPARGEVCRINPPGKIPTQRYGRLFREHQSIEESGQKREKEFWVKKILGKGK